MGIGLELCKILVERHGGRIILVTESGKGCLFTVELPLLPPGRCRAPVRDGGDDLRIDGARRNNLYAAHRFKNFALADRDADTHLVDRFQD